MYNDGVLFVNDITTRCSNYACFRNDLRSRDHKQKMDRALAALIDHEAIELVNPMDNKYGSKGTMIRLLNYEILNEAVSILN